MFLLRKETGKDPLSFLILERREYSTQKSLQNSFLLMNFQIIYTMKRTLKLLILSITMGLMMQSCSRESESVTPLSPQTSIVGHWFNDVNNTYAQGDTTTIYVNANQYAVTELDYVIYQPILMTYDAATNHIALSGTQGNYTIDGTGYLIGNDTLHLDYTVDPGMTTIMHSTWYRQH
jgi:hypothetical protein